MAPATGSAATGTSVIPFAITTTYTAPTQCAQSVGGMTMLEIDQYRVWLNAILPVPGTTVTSCYPSQYVSSFLLQSGGVSQAPLSPLVCPAGYTTQGPFTSNYIACCPSGWDGLALATNAPSDRPAFGGTCYTNIYNVPLSISFYDNSALKATSIFTATDISAQAFAYPYEGFALGVAIVASIPSTKSSPQSTSTSTTSSLTSSFSSAPASTAPPSAHRLSKGAIAAIVVGSLLGIALLLAAAFLILHHRRKNFLKHSSGSERQFNNSGPDETEPDADPTTLKAGYFKPNIKELYGSEEIKNHGEPQELPLDGLYELCAGQTSQELDTVMNLDAEAGEMGREKNLPNLLDPESHVFHD